MGKYNKFCIESCTPYGHDEKCHNAKLQNISKFELMKEVDQLLDENSALKDLIEEKNIYADGIWRCPKCELRVVSSFISSQNGNTAPNNEPQKCPNNCGSMWRITWKQEALSARKIAGDIFEEIFDLKARLAHAESEYAKERTITNFVAKDATALLDDFIFAKKLSNKRIKERKEFE